MTNLHEIIAELRRLHEAATPQDIDTAEEIAPGIYECPMCDGEGAVPGVSFTNYDGRAAGVQFFGVGETHKHAEARPNVAVYVDDMYRQPMGRFRRMKMSHMIADTDEELHAMAARIGVARKWHQGDHYDIAMSKRALAIQCGAKAISLKQLACMSALRRRGLPMGDPETAIDRFVAARRPAHPDTVEPRP
ncbi:MAG: DUF4031 domain-containing protein [Pseudomonadota bacterium]